MSGLKNTFKRLHNFGTFKGYKTNQEIREEKLAKIQHKKDVMFQSAEVPDEEAIKRNERRKAAKRQGSRANTVLTEEREQLG
jgi:hypothetical protein